MTRRITNIVAIKGPARILHEFNEKFKAPLSLTGGTITEEEARTSMNAQWYSFANFIPLYQSDTEHLPIIRFKQWGTKADLFNVSVMFDPLLDLLIYRFGTLNHQPREVFKRMEKDYPMLSFDIYHCDDYLGRNAEAHVWKLEEGVSVPGDTELLLNYSEYIELQVQTIYDIDFDVRYTLPQLVLKPEHVTFSNEIVFVRVQYTSEQIEDIIANAWEVGRTQRGSKSNTEEEK